MDKGKAKKVAVFDFDGTIVDSMGTFAKIASRVMPKYYTVDAATAHRLYLTTSGIPFFEQLETIFPGHPQNPKAANEYETIKKESYFTKKIFTDVPEAIRDLKNNKIKVIVSSNNFQELVNEFVSRTKMSFDMVLGYKNNFAKGADHFNYIMKRLGCTREEMVFIGDSLKDAERARDFGIDFIGKEGIFNGDEFKKLFPKTKVIKTLTELKEIIS